MEANEVVKTVTSRENDVGWTERTTRMDADYNIWSNVPTEKDTHQGTINITTPDFRSFADELQKGLVRSERNISIYMAEKEGTDERDNISMLERLFIYCYDKADLLLLMKGLIPLKDQLTWFGMIRGEMVVRMLNRRDKKGFIPDYLSPDPRWLTYQYGNNGLEWVNSKTFRSKDDLKANYDLDIPARGDGEGTEFYDYWDIQSGRVVNTLVSQNQVLRENKYDLKTIPFLIVPIATRPQVVDRSGLRSAGHGDSIYAAVRGFVPVINKMLTLRATWANRLAHAPLAYIKADANDDDITEEQLYTEIGTVINLPPGSSLKRIPLPEISQTLMTLSGELSAQRQRATAPNVVFGDVVMPSSGTAISELKEAEEKAYFLSLTALDTIYTRMCYMIEEQILDQKLKFPIDGVQDGKFYEDKITPVDIKRAHIIKTEHTIRSRFGTLQAMETGQMALMLQLPLEYIWDKILKIQDPKRLKELKEAETLDKDPVQVARHAQERAMKEGRIDDAIYYREIGETLLRMRFQQPSGMAQAGQQPTGFGEVSGIPQGGVNASQ